MQDNQAQLAQLAKSQRDEFQRQVKLMEQRHQALLRQLVQKQRDSSWRRLLDAASTVKSGLLGHVCEHVLHMRSWQRTLPQKNLGCAPSSAVIDVIYTVSATGEIEQTELLSEKEA